jgi:3-deoxy-D-manno-octulosonate 8-phosphate phosphatase (KDO 8-P phosphatase)
MTSGKGDSEHRIRMFGMDVDGVLTDEGIYLGTSDLEFKRFNVHDGMGITLIRAAGIVPFIITARTSAAVARRGRELGIEEVHQGIRDKLTCLREIASRHGVSLGEIAFIGDDLSDLTVLWNVGLPIAVGNATAEARQAARFVTSRKGGDGAVREACEYILKLNGYEGPLAALLGIEPRKGAGA